MARPRHLPEGSPPAARRPRSRAAAGPGAKSARRAAPGALAREREEAARAERLRFVESLDRVNRALQGQPDLERALRSVLDVVLSDLDCDRAFLLHPCDPDAPGWRVPLERTRPGYPGAGEQAAEVPMDAGAARVLRTLLHADGPVRFDPATQVPQAEELAQRFGYLSSMMVALRPKLGAPWVFGVHQCRHARVWSGDQATLLNEIGRRLEDALTSLLAFRSLQDRERELRSLVENLPDMLSRFDLQGRLVWANPVVSRTFGAPLEQIVGRSLADLPPAEDRATHARLLEGILAVARTGLPNQMEVAWTLPSGLRRFEVRHFAETDACGRVASVLGLARDVTDRQAAEGQVALLTFALDNVRESAFLIDEEAGFRYVNEEACRELGYTRAELLRMGVPDIDPDFPVQRWRGYWSEVVARGAMLFESRHRTRDGRLVPVEINVSYLEYEGRAYNLALVRDITERKAAEQALLRHAAVVEASDDAIVTKSPEGLITSWNRGAEAIFGYTAQEVVGQPILTLIPEHLLHEEERILAEIRAGRSVAHYETVRRRKDGRLIDVSVTVSPLLAADGRLAGVSKIARDITVRKQAEAELQRHRERLEEMVAERTTALREANDELESFSYSVSHDLRTPLRAVDGFSRMLAARYGHLLDDEARRLIGVVRDNSARMARLIDDILAFSRSGRVEMRRVQVDMDRLVEEAWLELEPVRAGRSIQFEHRPLAPARGDPALLRQVWVNLLANAIKFTRPRPEARIEVGGAGADGAGYSVTDNGVGFETAYAHKLFGVFQRLHGVEEFEGTGIGLAIVKRIVSRHGGQVCASSRAGQGASFRFTLGSQEG